jgi:tRNA(Leu) C34 or U34 (ribose-2'-O)-methylase TrmL
MDGKDDRIIDTLRLDMLQSAERLDFERAAKLRDRLEAIETILVKNTMVLPDRVDADVFGIAYDHLHAASYVFRVRGGRVKQARGWVMDTDTEPRPHDLVEAVLRDGFDDQFPPAKLVIVPTLPKDVELFSERLTEARAQAGEKGGVEIRVAKRGELAALSDTVKMNAKHTLQSYVQKRSTDVVARSAALAELGDALGLDEAPLRIECFDVSHLGGESQVASMVVFEDGLPRRDHYRKFAIDDARDDTDAIYQVVSRRLRRLVDEGNGNDDLEAVELATDERVGDETVGVGPWEGPLPSDHHFDPDLLAGGDRRNVADRYRYWTNDAIVADLDLTRHPFHVAIENWVHDRNIGTVVRTANAFNAAAVHIVGRRRWNRRGAMVTDRYQHLHHHGDVDALLAWAAQAGLPMVGIDNLPGSVALETAVLPAACMLVFGQEGPGLSAPAQAACTQVLSIAQFGSTRSINAGVAAGIAMHAWVRQHAVDPPTQDTISRDP